MGISGHFVLLETVRSLDRHPCILNSSSESLNSGSFIFSPSVESVSSTLLVVLEDGVLSVSLVFDSGDVFVSVDIESDLLGINGSVPINLDFIKFSHVVFLEGITASIKLFSLCSKSLVKFILLVVVVDRSDSPSNHLFHVIKLSIFGISSIKNSLS